MEFTTSHDPQGWCSVKITPDGEREYVAVKLPDGREVEIFPSGTVQVYTPDARNGYELRLPKFTANGKPRARSADLHAL